MVWGMIWLDGRSELQIMERDLSSKRQGFTAWSYQEALEAGLLPHYEAGDIFQQDNAKIHTAKTTKEWLESRGI